MHDTESQRANLLFPINLRAKHVTVFNPGSMEETLLAAQLMPVVFQLLAQVAHKASAGCPRGGRRAQPRQSNNVTGCHEGGGAGGGTECVLPREV